MMSPIGYMVSDSLFISLPSYMALSEGILYTHGAYTARLKKAYDQQIFDLINSSVWGTKENRYSHRSAAEHLPYLNDPHFFCLYKGEELCALVVFNRRKVRNQGKEFTAFYVRYFLASEKYKGRGIVPRHAEKVMEYLKNHVEKPMLLYAAVEKKNRNSYRVVERQGFKSMGTMRSIGFSRFFPKRRLNLEVMKDPEEIKILLSQQNINHGLLHFGTHFQGQPYLVFKENGRIRAGIQLQKSHWQIQSMSGLMGWFVIHVLPYIPFLNRIFNPKAFHFLSFEGIYLAQGYEHLLLPMLESALAGEGYHSSLFFLDTRDPVYSLIEKQKSDMGLLYKFTQEANSHLMVYTSGFSEKELNLFAQNPLYTCAYDCI